MKKRFLGLLLTLCLIMSMFSGLSLSASAAVGDKSWYTMAESYEGTADCPYLLHDTADLEGLAELVNSDNDFSGKYIKLADDFDCGGIALTSPIGSQTFFRGNFDGNGKTVLLDLNYPNGTYIAMFGRLFKATVSDLTVTGSVIGDNSVAGISGYSYRSDVSNCTNQAYITGRTTVGGICGMNHGTLNNCTNTGAIHATDPKAPNAGVIYGKNGDFDEKGEVSGCKNTGALICNSYTTYSEYSSGVMAYKQLGSDGSCVKYDIIGKVNGVWRQLINDNGNNNGAAFRAMYFTSDGATSVSGVTVDVTPSVIKSKNCIRFTYKISNRSGAPVSVIPCFNGGTAVNGSDLADNSLLSGNMLRTTFDDTSFYAYSGDDTFHAVPTRFGLHWAKANTVQTVTGNCDTGFVCYWDQITLDDNGSATYTLYVSMLPSTANAPTVPQDAVPRSINRGGEYVPGGSGGTTPSDMTGGTVSAGSDSANTEASGAKTASSPSVDSNPNTGIAEAAWSF